MERIHGVLVPADGPDPAATREGARAATRLVSELLAYRGHRGEQYADARAQARRAADLYRAGDYYGASLAAFAAAQALHRQALVSQRSQK